MKSAGKIIKINSDLSYGFVQVPKVGDVFFSSETQFHGLDFGSLQVNDSVTVEILDTERGLFASSLGASAISSKRRPPEVGL